MLRAVPFGTLNKKNGVFVGFFLRSKLYKNYHHVSAEIQNSDYIQVLLLMRWDSTLGFPGGFMDRGESLPQAALREVQEEIHFFTIDPTQSREERTHLSQSYIERLTPLISHQIKDDMNVHFYSCEITPQERDMICTNAHRAKDYSAEVAGVNFVHCIQRDSRGVYTLLKSDILAVAVKEELEVLLREQLESSV